MKNFYKNNKGISNIIILASIVSLLLVLTVIFYQIQNKKEDRSGIRLTKPSNEIVQENEPECATKEMFSNDPAKILEPLSETEIENMVDFSSDYQGFLSFKGNKGDKILSVSGASIGNAGEMFVVNKLLDEGSRFWRTSSYNFLPVNCISPIPAHMIELNNKIKRVVIKDNPIVIYEKPGCCTGYNADVHYYIEVPIEFQEKAKSKYIEITPWYYDLIEFEKVIRSLRLEVNENNQISSDL